MLNSTSARFNKFLFPLAALFDYSPVMYKNIVSPYFMVARSLSSPETADVRADFGGGAHCRRRTCLFTAVVYLFNFITLVTVRIIVVVYFKILYTDCVRVVKVVYTWCSVSSYVCL